ncbi:HERC5_1 [Blepharisma stoltei]|uniref:Uncharacterized protein n=1 Tax=Blepharisma stoltei TaxID=1481888 RepID=A0AAU9KFL1_9CILI|nr:unnamed protein product [Blepharisma stoltei]
MSNMRYAAIWSPRNLPSTADLPIPTIYSLPKASIKTFHVTDNLAVALTEKGKLWELKTKEEESKDTIRRIKVPIEVKQLSINENAGLFIGKTGGVYVWGKDVNQDGIFGIPNLYEIPTPTPIDLLSDVFAVNGAIGTSHAAIIDRIGHLYTWGTGDCGQLGSVAFSCYSQEPTLVESAKIFSAKQVICGESFTCICTGGGYVYLYGSIGTCHSNAKGAPRQNLLRSFSPTFKKDNTGNYPYTLPELEHHFTTQVTSGSGFISVLTDTGEVFTFDECMDLVKMPAGSKSTVKIISSTKNIIYGIAKEDGEDVLYEWRESFQERLSSYELLGCNLVNWTGRIYIIDEMFSKFPTLGNSIGNYMSIIYEFENNAPMKPVGKYLSTMMPYKRSEYAKKLISSAQDSLDMRIISPIPSPRFGERSGAVSPTYLSQGSPIPNCHKSYDDLERLYPTGDNTKTIGAIVKCRIEYDAREKILRAFQPVVLPIVEEFMLRLKEYGFMIIMYKRTIAATTIPNIIIKIFQRFHVVSLSSGFQAIRNFSNKKLLNMIEIQRKEINSKIKREEAVKSLSYDLGKIFLKRIQHGFSQLKKLEMINYQQRCAALSLKQFISEIVYFELKKAFSEIKNQEIIPKIKLETHMKEVQIQKEDSTKKICKVLKKRQNSNLLEVLRILKHLDWSLVDKRNAVARLDSTLKGIFKRITNDHFTELKEINFSSMQIEKKEIGISMVLEENIRNFDGIFKKMLIRQLQYGFGLLKNLKLKFYQEKCSLLSLKQILSEIVFFTIRSAFAEMKNFGYSLSINSVDMQSKESNANFTQEEVAKKLALSLEKISLRARQFGFSFFKNVQLNYYQKKCGILSFNNIFRKTAYANMRIAFDKFKDNKISKSRHVLLQEQSEALKKLDVIIWNANMNQADYGFRQLKNSVYSHQRHIALPSMQILKIENLEQHPSSKSYDYMNEYWRSHNSTPGIKNNPKKLKFIVKKNERPPWKPTSISSGFVPIRKVDVSPTSLRLNYDSELKVRKQRIHEKKSIMQVQSEENSCIKTNITRSRFSKYENDPVFQNCIKNLESGRWREQVN